MKQLFASTTIKLTAWYLAILMTISVIFSVILFQVAMSELSSRFAVFETRLQAQNVSFEDSFNFSEIRERQQREAQATLLIALIYLNLAILVFGGLASYAFARRSLKPIEASHEAQARFAADASHELRTPLAVMRSELEVALRDPKLPKTEMRELLESNLEEVNRLSDLSQALLELSRHDSSHLTMKRLNLNEILKDTQKALGKENSRITFKKPSSKFHFINGHSESVKELILILLDNALRYSPTDSTVPISIHSDRQLITVEIRNSGKGIHPNDLPHVFDRFYRGDKSRTGASSGYGLGLSLAKKIADVHNARIEITSTPNKLTSVSVIFEKYKKM